MPHAQEVKFLAAGIDQAGEVLAVLDEAAGWLQQRGVKQWPPRFELAWIEGPIRRGETWLVTVDGTVSGTVTLDRSDRLWEGVPRAAALHIHRMAVRRSAAGLGAVILGWAADSASRLGLEVLRLDCVASNARLRAYYEAAGFVHCGDARVAGAPGQRLDEGQVTVVSRYQRRLSRGGSVRPRALCPSPPPGLVRPHRNGSAMRCGSGGGFEPTSISTIGACRSWFSTASLGVTRALGYRPNGVQIDDREGKPVRHLRFPLTRAEREHHRSADFEIENLQPCLGLLGLADEGSEGRYGQR